MKKEDPDNKQPEYTRYSEDEEQVLDLNELMDVQGGIDDKELSKCGLGFAVHHWGRVPGVSVS